MSLSVLIGYGCIPVLKGNWSWLNSFFSLLPDRKLKTLSQKPLNHLSDTKDGYSLLLFWYWEQSLKERYLLLHFFSFLDSSWFCHFLNMIVSCNMIRLSIESLSIEHDGYCLICRYEQFVSALQEASLDVIVRLKSMALKVSGSPLLVWRSLSFFLQIS